MRGQTCYASSKEIDSDIPRSLTAAGSNVTVIPNFSEANEPMQLLKQRSASAKPLGLIKVASNELLVIFDGTSAKFSSGSVRRIMG